MFTSASPTAVRCAPRHEALFATAFFPQGVQTSTEVPFLGMDHPLEHIVKVDSNGDTIPSEQSPCAWCDLYTLSPDEAQLFPSFHRCTPSTQTPSTLAHMGHAVHSESCVFMH